MSDHVDMGLRQALAELRLVCVEVEPDARRYRVMAAFGTVQDAVETLSRKRDALLNRAVRGRWEKEETCDGK